MVFEGVERVGAVPSDEVRQEAEEDARDLLHGEGAGGVGGGLLRGIGGEAFSEPIQDVHCEWGDRENVGREVAS